MSKNEWSYISTPENTPSSRDAQLKNTGTTLTDSTHKKWSVLETENFVLKYYNREV
jgi:hypothetical protein